MSEGGQWSTPVAPTAEGTQPHGIEWVWTTFASLAGSLQSASQFASWQHSASPSLPALPALFPPCDEFGLVAPCSPQRPNATKRAKAAEALPMATQTELGCSFEVCKDSWPGEDHRSPLPPPGWW